MPDLSGVTVMVAGAGLAGLTAARDLIALGARVTVVDARDRVGGRVLTVRNGFSDSQHAEAGGDLIDEAHESTRALAGELGLKLARILHNGWAYVRADAHGRTQIVRRRGSRGWERMSEALSRLTERYRLAERRWDSPVTAEMGRRSVSQWLDDIHADEELRTTAIGLRGFFLADPDQLSLLALVDQFAEDEAPVWRNYRIVGGNDRLAAALAEPLRDRLHLGTELVAVSHRGKGVRASLKQRQHVTALDSDYAILALPPALLRRIPIAPALPTQQHDAIARLKFGHASKTLLQFSRRFWRIPGRPRAFGSALPFGAVWDGNEEQRGPSGILSLMAGGSASDATAALLARDGAAALARSLDWMGSKRAELLGWHHTAWETDPWARGGYAYFDPAFDPALRAWLARPCGRLFFAGEHTSIRWQGYMNGAIESGRRAAAEVAAVHAQESSAPK
jgi:monoamine oxidase